MTRLEEQLALLERVIADKNDHRGVGGQHKLALECGVTDAVFSAIRTRTYNGDEAKYLQMVEHKYSRETVLCPFLGEITLGKCAEKRDRPFAATNPTRVALSRACKVCDRRKS